VQARDREQQPHDDRDEERECDQPMEQLVAGALGMDLGLVPLFARNV
jgi:hypothetical protein